MAIRSGSISSGLKRATSERLFTNWRLSLIGIFAFSIALYFRALSGSPISDDYQHLSGSSIGGGTFLGALTQPFLHEYYRPLTSLSYFFDLKLWGPNPAMWHLTNLVIHGLAAVGIAALAWIGIRRKDVAVCAGLFFAVQPAQVGAVAWIGGRTDELSAFFATTYLIALVSYFTSGKKWVLFAASGLFFLACATKEQNLGFLAAAPILEYSFGTHTKRRLIWTTLAVFVAAVAFAALWLTYYPNPHALGGPGALAVLRRMLLAYWYYAGQLLLPNPKSLICFSLSPYSWVWLIPASVLAIATPWAVWRTYKFDKRAGAFLLTFLAVYLPVSNLITIPSTQVAPYRIANASILIALLFGWFLAEGISKKRWLPTGLLAGNFLLSLVISSWAIGKWSNEADWWNTCLQYDPHDRLVVRSATSAFMNMPNGSLRAARVVEQYMDWLYDGNSWQTAIDQGKLPALTPQLRTKFTISLGGLIDSHVLLAQLMNLRGAALAGAHQNQEALNSFVAGLRLSADNGYAAGIGDLLLPTNRNAALSYYRIAVAEAPSYQNLFALGREVQKDGNPHQAAELLTEAIEEQPQAGDAWVQLGLTELKLGGARKAQVCFDTASSLHVNDQASLEKLGQALSKHP